MSSKHEPEIAISITVDDVAGDVRANEVSLAAGVGVGAIEIVIVEHDHAQPPCVQSRVVLKMVVLDSQSRTGKSDQINVGVAEEIVVVDEAAGRASGISLAILAD